MYTSKNNVQYVDANLNAPDNAISGNECDHTCIHGYMSEIKTKPISVATIYTLRSGAWKVYTTEL